MLEHLFQIAEGIRLRIIEQNDLLETSLMIILFFIGYRIGQFPRTHSIVPPNVPGAIFHFLGLPKHFIRRG